MEIKLSSFTDDRGEFTRLFSQDELKEAGLEHSIVQVNHSINRSKATVRGMHFQYPPHAETKIIGCVRGKVWDVIVDLRKGSSSFLKWHAIILSPELHNMSYIPRGCAHGFQAMEDNSELVYLHTEFYNPKSEGSVRYDDPVIGIDWPLPPAHVSDKDKNYPLLTQLFTGIEV